MKKVSIEKKIAAKPHSNLARKKNRGEAAFKFSAQR